MAATIFVRQYTPVHAVSACGFPRYFQCRSPVGYDGYYVQSAIANHDSTISLLAAIYSIEPSDHRNNRFVCTIIRNRAATIRLFSERRGLGNVFLRFAAHSSFLSGDRATLSSLFFGLFGRTASFWRKVIPSFSSRIFSNRERLAIISSLVSSKYFNHSTACRKEQKLMTGLQARLHELLVHYATDRQTFAGC